MTTPTPVPTPATVPVPIPGDEKSHAIDFPQMALLLALCWALTNIAYAIYDLPLKFMLKDQLHLDAARVSGFFALGMVTNYVKPLAGILIDSVPLFGTRRRAYLLGSLFLCGVGWLVLASVPRSYGVMLAVFAVTYSMVVVISTSLGGVMVETAQRFGAAGRLTAQRIAMFRVGTLAGGPLGGLLATLPLIAALGCSALLHFALIPLIWLRLREAHVPVLPDRRLVWQEARRQLRGLGQSRTVLTAAGMICLIAAAPGFGTPLLFYQTDTLHFSKPFLGMLTLVGAASGLTAAVLYHTLCQKRSMQQILTVSIVVHALGTLFYLLYRGTISAILITALEGATVTLATLPVYDLAARGTPKGSEALGYSVMMSVWNLTLSLSDWTGSSLFAHLKFSFDNLVWLNAGTTALVLLVVPLFPRALLAQKDEKQHGVEPGGNPEPV